MPRRTITVRWVTGCLLLAALWLPTRGFAQPRDTFRPVQNVSPNNRARRAEPKRPNSSRGSMNAFVQRLMEVNPARRREMLANNRRFQRLPTAQRRTIEARLERFDKLPANDRELMVQRYQLFSRLGPNRQSQARTVYREWSELPRARRNRITQVVRRLRNTPPKGRQDLLESERFAGQFDQDDRAIIEKLLSLTPPRAATDRDSDRQRH